MITALAVFILSFTLEAWAQTTTTTSSAPTVTSISTKTRSLIAPSTVSSSIPSNAPVISVYAPRYGEDDSLLGSVIGADSTATTINIDCRQGPRVRVCDLPSGGINVTKSGPTGNGTMEYDGNYNGPVEQYAWRCGVNSQSAVCTTTQNAQNGATNRTVVRTYSPVSYYNVTITAGTDKLAAATATTTTVGGSGGTGTIAAGASSTSRANAAPANAPTNAVGGLFAMLGFFFLLV